MKLVMCPIGRQVIEREIYRAKEEKNDQGDIPIEFEELTELPKDLSSEQFMALIKKEEE